MTTPPTPAGWYPDPETTVINPATAEINGKHRRDWV